MHGREANALRAVFASITLVLLLAPAFVLAAEVPQSDAGSGQDAPNVARPDVVIAPQVTYEGLVIPTRDHFDFYAFQVPAVTDLQFSLVGAGTCIGAFFDGAGRSLATSCVTEAGATFYTARAGGAGLHYLRVGAGFAQATSYRFVLAVGGEAPHPLLPSDPMTPGSDPTCGTGVPVTKNGGTDGGVTYGALKTGFRAMVVYKTAAPSIETLTFGIDGGDTTSVSDAYPRLDHIFILDGLPRGRTLCFTPGDGVARAIKLVNAQTSWDGSVYTVNMLLTASENMVRARDILEAGFDIYAEKLFDSTDGHVRAGQMVLLSYPEHTNTGTLTCFSFGVNGAPNCDKRVDATFSHDSCIGGAACATLDGITRPDEFIMMNSIYDANPVLGDLLYGPNEVGSVLLHEFGHYAFGSADLYVNGDCYNAALSLSIMGASRSVTEVDDEVHRCPNENQLSGYIPTWTRMRWRFGQIPDRTGPIAEGPHGGGGVYARHTFALLPATDSLENAALPQDDAGTGADAGNSIATATPIEPGVLYDGSLASTSDRDVYVFPIARGQTFDALVYPGGTCHDVVNAAGSTIASSCSTDGVHTWVRGTAPGGPLYLRIGLGSAPVHQFGVGVDEPGPSPFPTM